MSHLHIYDRRERTLVGTADRLLQAAAAALRPFRHRRRPGAPRRILLLRLERIGDLLVALPALAEVRRLAPDADIDLVVGSWNRAVAELIPAVTRVRTLDARWLAREGTGRGVTALLAAARAWRSEQYDLAINFEPDIRSNVMVALSGARWIVGFGSAGGGPLLDLALEYDTSAHVTDNARRVVFAAFGVDDGPSATAAASLVIPAAAHAEAERRLTSARGPLVGVHASGGRAIKQWNVERFAAVARHFADQRRATIVLTGSSGDRPLVDAISRELPPDRVVDLAGSVDLPTLAAVLARLDVFITGDTGPMHMATMVGTPVVAIFGPSDPARYGPRGPHDRIVRIDLPCSPCNRIRLPPARCTGHTPDCLAGIPESSVFDAADEVLRICAGRARAYGGRG